jgi:hypothetical protein
LFLLNFKLDGIWLVLYCRAFVFVFTTLKQDRKKKGWKPEKLNWRDCIETIVRSGTNQWSLFLLAWLNRPSLKSPMLCLTRNRAELTEYWTIYFYFQRPLQKNECFFISDTDIKFELLLPSLLHKLVLAVFAFLHLNFAAGYNGRYW